MGKRPLGVAACGMVLGILLAAFPKWYLMLAVMVCMIWITASFWKKKKGRYAIFYVILFLLTLVIGTYRYESEIAFEQSYEALLSDGMNIEVQGQISKKEFQSEQIVYALDHCYLNLNEGIIPSNQILVYLDTDEYPIGKTILVTGKLNMWRQAVNEGNFDEKSFYFSRKIAFKITNAKITESYGKSNPYLEALILCKQKLRSVYENSLNEKEAGVLTTMILGDKSILDDEIKELYQKVGISHMLAISGLHVSYIGMALYQFLRKRKLSFGEAGTLSAVAIVSFGFMSGMGTSTFRAILMFLLSVLAAWLGRSYDSISSLSLAAIVLLVENPFLLWYAGFLFSFAAVSGVIFLGKALQSIRYEPKDREERRQGQREGDVRQKKEQNEEIGGKKRAWLLFLQKKRIGFEDTLKISVAIQLATLPLAAFYYYEIPTYSILVNFLLLPFLGYVLLFGLLGGWIGLLSPLLAKGIFLPCQFILGAYECVCQATVRLPKAVWIVGRPEIWKMVVFYMLLVVCYLFMKKCRKKRFILLAIFSLLPLFAGNGGKGFELTMLDVGQGDGIFLRTEDGVDCFVDGGSTDVSKVGTYRILPFLKSNGVQSIQYWFVTHMDEDHISGLKELYEAGYPVENLVLSKWILQDENYQEMCLLAEENGTKIIYMDVDNILHTKTASFTCLSPSKDLVSDDRNVLSLVLQYEELGVTALLTGDISSEEEEELLGKVEVCEIYKAAHHGSKYSNSAEFLQEVSPAISLISCGEDNRYGHPGQEAVANMEETGSDIFYTMQSGQIKVTRKEDCIQVEKYLDDLDVCSYPVVE